MHLPADLSAAVHEVGQIGHAVPAKDLLLLQQLGLLLQRLHGLEVLRRGGWVKVKKPHQVLFAHVCKQIHDEVADFVLFHAKLFQLVHGGDAFEVGDREIPQPRVWRGLAQNVGPCSAQARVGGGVVGLEAALLQPLGGPGGLVAHGGGIDHGLLTDGIADAVVVELQIGLEATAVVLVGFVAKHVVGPTTVVAHFVAFVMLAFQEGLHPGVLRDVQAQAIALVVGVWPRSHMDGVRPIVEPAGFFQVVQRLLREAGVHMQIEHHAARGVGRCSQAGEVGHVGA